MIADKTEEAKMENQEEEIAFDKPVDQPVEEVKNEPSGTVDSAHVTSEGGMDFDQR